VFWAVPELLIGRTQTRSSKDAAQSWRIKSVRNNEERLRSRLRFVVQKQPSGVFILKSHTQYGTNAGTELAAGCVIGPAYVVKPHRLIQQMALCNCR
jgi:hypothetical protein